ncbi:hypothetical protein WG66_012999 [Moniliophthora roreri]|nr:hypothetical protein WG66_012999 [Moniliophthora roreri]
MARNVFGAKLNGFSTGTGWTSDSRGFAHMKRLREAWNEGNKFNTDPSIILFGHCVLSPWYKLFAAEKFLGRHNRLSTSTPNFLLNIVLLERAQHKAWPRHPIVGPDNTPASNPANSNPPSTVFLNLSRLQSHQHSQDTPIEVRNPFSLSRFVVSGINQDNATPGILRRGHTFHFLYLRLTITTANTFGCQQSHASCTETRRDATVRLRILLYYAL